VIVLARLFFFGIYKVEGRSMVPTLQAGESVLVSYGEQEIERFDLVVLRRPSEKRPKVKRVVGLPGESVQLVNGDLVVNGDRLSLQTPRPPLVAVYDDSVDPVEEWFQMGSTQMDPWKKTAEGWLLEAKGVARGAAAGTMFFAKRLTAGHISGDAEAGPGGASAADYVLSCDVRLGEQPAELNFILREQGDTFRAELRSIGSGAMNAKILQRWKGGEELLLAEGELLLSAEGWSTLRFGNIDNSVFFEASVPDHSPQLLVARDTANHLDPSDRLAMGETYGHRLGLGGAAGEAEFRSIKVFRDHHYTGRGAYGSTEPVRLGPHEYFLLGDNSPESRDGRDWGPSSEGEILGRPLWVVSPLGGLRSLRTGRTAFLTSSAPL
jgi:type IV secretory pathway protease TraF